MKNSHKNLLEQRARSVHSGARFQSRPYDLQKLYVSLKQWRILHAVVDCGGYAEAAKTLHLSQSTISYTISKLQDQLGVSLLKIEGRKAALTTEGRLLLARSRHLLKEAIELEAFAKSISKGGGEVRLAVDHNFPSHLLIHALNKFSQLSNGSAHVKLNEGVRLHAEDVLRDHGVDLAICESVPLGFLGEPLIEVEYVPVAHPDHPLLRLNRDMTMDDLEQYTRIVVGGASERERDVSAGSKQSHIWRMSSMDTVIEAVSGCLGFAWLPQHRIQHSLESGALVRLPLSGKCEHKIVLYLIHGRPWAINQAVVRLSELLRSAAAACSEQQEADAA